jgi:uncharacterized membrane protein
VSLIWALALAGVLAGCANPATVMMRNPKTNEIVRCEAGYRRFLAGRGYLAQGECIANYQRKGYEQMLAPVTEQK